MPTSETIKNPSVPTLVAPVDLDAAIQKLQLSIANNITWIEKSFGRAKLFRVTDAKGNKILQPRVYQGGREYYNVLPNDALRAYSFFRVRSAREFDEYNPNARTFYQSTPIDLIVWANLQRVDSTKDYDFTEELMHEVLTIVNRDVNVTVERVIDDPIDEIFRGFTLSSGHRDLLLFPYTAFRFEILLRYELKCP